MIFRYATSLDSLLLFNWRNDPLTRRNSFNSEEITYESHCKWLESSLLNTYRKIIILDFNNTSIGTLRIDYDPEWNPEISWTIAPEYRKKGYGKILLREGIKLRDISLAMGIPLCKIRSFNQASIKIALSSGFKLVSVEGEDTLVFKL